MSDIQVIGERRMESQDLRFPTPDTQFATALLLFGFKLAEEPFTTRINVGTTGVTTTIWFVPVITEKPNGDLFQTPLEAQAVLAKWLTPGEDQEYPSLDWMRGAMRSRHRIIKETIYGDKLKTGNINRDWWVTDSLPVSAVLDSCGYPLRLYRDRRFYHDAKAIISVRKMHAKVEPKSGQDCDVRELWGLMAIEQQSRLMLAINGPENVKKQVVPGPNKKTLWMADKMPEELKRIHLHELLK